MSEQNSDPSRPVDPPVPPTAPPAPPQAPPAPPAAPQPARPDVPKYGEYAPVDATNPYGVPGYAAAPAAAAPSSAAAPTPPAYGGPSYPPSYAPPVRKRRTWDVVLTSILLVLGLFGMLAGVGYAAIFATPDLLDQTMASAGYGGFAGNVGAAPAVLLISHIALYLLALGLSIPLLIRGKVVVFWIPLTIGVVAAIIFWATVFSVILSDPSFMSKYGG